LAKKSQTLDKTPIRSNLSVPAYVRSNVNAYIADHPGTTFGTVVLRGFASLGIAIDPEDMKAERPRRNARTQPPDLKPEDDITTTLVLPHYVRARAEAYLLNHGDMRLRNLVMAGFASLGIEIRPEDLKTERRNPLGARSNPGDVGRPGSA
jgi:hypothetical protein